MTYSNPTFRLDGDQIPANDHNDVAERSVWRFATVSERDAAFPTPGIGQLCTLPGVTQMYTSSGWKNLAFADDVPTVLQMASGLDPISFSNQAQSFTLVNFGITFAAPPIVVATASSATSPTQGRVMNMSIATVNVGSAEVYGSLDANFTGAVYFSWYAVERTVGP